MPAPVKITGVAGVDQEGREAGSGHGPHDVVPAGSARKPLYGVRRFG